MIHFNELYITEDGKHLVIDTAIDDISVYNRCYIESISVTTASKLCGDDKTGCDFIPVYTGGTGLTYVDIDGDGSITDCDIDIIDRINDILGKIQPDNINNKYDIDGNGVVDLRDLTAIVNVILGTNKVSDFPNTPDVSGDGEVNVADINDWMSYFIEFRTSSKLTKEEREFMFDQYDDETGERISRGMFDLYVTLLQDPNVERKQSAKPLRHVRLCLSSIDVYLKNNKSLSDDLFIVRVKAKMGGNIAEILSLGCGWDITELTGAAYNMYPIYRNFMRMAESQSDECNSNMNNLVDFILKYNAFDYALRIGDWCQAWKYFQYLKSNNMENVSFNKGCGCHGIYR